MPDSTGQSTGTAPSTERSALIEPVTGLSTRYHFDLLLDFAFGLARRDIPVTLVLCQIRGIGRYAEHLGVSRDHVLGVLGERLRIATRGIDAIASFGEDRVACLLVNCNPWGAVVFVHRMNDVLQSPGEGNILSLSSGIAQSTEDMADPRDLVTVAERALDGALKEDAGRRLPIALGRVHEGLSHSAAERSSNP